MLEGYTKDTDMCTLDIIKTYLEQTKLLRGSWTRLLIASEQNLIIQYQEILF